MAAPPNAFDRHIEHLHGHAPAGAIEAAQSVRDTLETAWITAQTVFGDRATPELALAVYDRLLREREAYSAQTATADVGASAFSVEMGGFRVDDL